jgi:hypothetical protein
MKQTVIWSEMAGLHSRHTPLSRMITQSLVMFLAYLMFRVANIASRSELSLCLIVKDHEWLPGDERAELVALFTTAQFRLV